MKLEFFDVQAGEVRLHCAAMGPRDGPLAVLLHGFPDCWISWRKQLPALAAAGFRAVAPDLRGYGGSDKPRGVKAYRQGTRPDPIQVFHQLVETIDCFIDFDHSLADQHAMCEMIACYILATWFLDAFKYNGQRLPGFPYASGGEVMNVSPTLYDLDHDGRISVHDNYPRGTRFEIELPA